MRNSFGITVTHDATVAPDAIGKAVAHATNQWTLGGLVGVWFYDTTGAHDKTLKVGAISVGIRDL